MRSSARPPAALLLACLFLVASPALAQRLDETPRVAVISAFPPEIGALNAATSDQKAYDVNGVRFMTGVLEDKPVVVFLSGVSMVNAAMTTQMALDRFNITHIVFSGIAGGVDEGLDIGDVVVADQWAQNLESAFARETVQVVEKLLRAADRKGGNENPTATRRRFANDCRQLSARIAHRLVIPVCIR